MYLAKEGEDYIIAKRLKYRLNVYLLKLVLTALMGSVFYLLASLTQWSFDPREWAQFAKDLVLLPTVIIGTILIIVD